MDFEFVIFSSTITRPQNLFLSRFIRMRAQFMRTNSSVFYAPELITSFTVRVPKNMTQNNKFTTDKFVARQLKMISDGYRKTNVSFDFLTNHRPKTYQSCRSEVNCCLAPIGSRYYLSLHNFSNLVASIDLFPYQLKLQERHIMAESRTATLFGTDYRSILDGTRVDNIWDAPPHQLLSLCIIALIAVFQPIALTKTRSRSLAFWVAILAIAAIFPEITSIPILSTIVSTRTSYPYIIVIPHSFSAAASYRSKHGDNVHFMKSLFLAFFLYGFGGSIVSDLLMGLPVTALSHVRIIPCYIIGWSLVWLFPFDIFFRRYSNSSSVLHYFLQACEAIDAVTTPMGRISRSARELQNKTSAPIVAGLFAGIGGAGLRHAVGESSSIEVLVTGFWKTLSYSVIWWWLAVRNCQDDTYNPFVGNVTSEEERMLLQEYNNCKGYGGSNMLRLIIVGSHTLWTILVGVGLVRGHPFVWLCKNVLVRFGAILAQFLRLGPGSRSIAVDKLVFVNEDKNDVIKKKKRNTKRKKARKKD